MKGRNDVIDQEEITVDVFAGGGGASSGIAQAIGRSPDVAINHDAAAIAMHAANHPETRHFKEDVWAVSPDDVTQGRPVGLLWLSPDCKHFSRAKGGKPVEKKIRSLAWVAISWAAKTRPRVIILENVREFEDWGPLVPRWECAACDWRGTEGQATLTRRGARRCPRCDGKGLRETADLVPHPERKGWTFKRFVGRLKAMGYAVAWKVLNAADFGAPTHRRRLFLVARCDGAEIVWPEPTHGDPKKIGRGLFDGHLKPWRTAAECIDWSIPCPSIFERKKPLAEKTLRRIAAGVKRYVLDNPKPFIVRFRGAPEGGAVNIDAPLPTITAGSYIKRPAGAGHALGVCTPFIVPLTHKGERRSHPVDEPLPTITGANRGEMAMVAPILVGAGGPDYAAKPREANRPLGSMTAEPRQALVSAFMSKYHGQKKEEHRCRPLDEPVNTLDTQNRVGLVAANLVHMNHGEKQWSAADDPLRTITSGNHAALVYSFLVKYFGTAVGQVLDEPMHTATGKHRFGLVTVEVDGEPYVIVDIGMRMLRPRELARGQGFPDEYLLTGTITSQVARIGNSVSPAVARALVEANYQAAVMGVGA